MQAKPRRPRRRKPQLNSSWLLMAVVWLPIALVLPKLLQNNFFSPENRLENRPENRLENRADAASDRSSPIADRPPSFEDAFQAVTGLAQQTDSVSQTREGIDQAQYDRWRQSQGQPPQPIVNLQPSEVQAIYQTYWQQGNCGSYAAPLDVACLDTMLTFGVQDGRSFLAGLSPDPQQAAIEVAQRRVDYRQRQQNSPNNIPSSAIGGSPVNPQLLMVGIARDRALQAFLVSSAGQNPAGSVRIATRPPGTPAQTNPDGSVRIANRPPSSDANSQSANPNADSHPLWSRFTGLLPDWLHRRDANSAADLDPKTVYANAKPFTVEVWIHVDGGYAPATGIVVRSDGLILTNYHVISNNPTPSIQLADGRKFNGQVITRDQSIDLALVQIQGASGLPTANMANSTQDVQAGDTVYAIGSPMGMHWKMSRAQVMRTGSVCGSRALDNHCIRTPSGFLFPGNSGGPLLNTKGEVIGVNRAIQESTGQGVSIPIEIVKQFLSRLPAGGTAEQPQP